MTEREEENRRLYLKAPTIEQIEKFRKKLKVSAAQFERFFGIPRATIRNIRVGGRDLPVKFWNIIYEEVVPTYGTKPMKKRKATKNETQKPNTEQPHNPTTEPKPVISGRLSRLSNKDVD